MEDNSAISMDGSWGHRRNATQCVVEWIDSRSKKIIDFECSERKNHRFAGDFVGSAQAMEVACNKKLIERNKGP